MVQDFGIPSLTRRAISCDDLTGSQLNSRLDSLLRPNPTAVYSLYHDGIGTERIQVRLGLVRPALKPAHANGELLARRGILLVRSLRAGGL